MATDIATLSIKIDNGDVVKATTGLESLAVAGGKTEAATNRLTRRMALLEIEARNMDAAMARGGAAMNALEVEARQMDAELEKSRRAMALLEVEARKMDAQFVSTAQRMAMLELEARKMDAEFEKSRRSMALVEIEARKMDAELGRTGRAMLLLEVEARQMDAAFDKSRRSMALLEIEARKMDAAMAANVTMSSKLGAALGLSEGAMSKLGVVFGGLSAVFAVGFIGRKTIEETKLAQAAMAQLEAAVASTGGVAGRTVAQLDALSMSLQRQTTFSDEAVKGAEAILLTFDKIRGAEFDQATQAITDLSTRMTQDLQTSAVQVGKALQDPEHGLTALRKAGVSFSASQIEVIKKLYATGQAAEGQRIILAELSKEFGGSAAAARDTLGGALEGLKNAWGDLFEVSRGASQGTVTAINAITASLQSNGLTMNQFVLNTVVGWEKIKAAAAGVWLQLSTPIGPGWSEKIRAGLQRIEFDMNAEIAKLTAPAKTGPVVKPPPIGIDVDTKDAAKRLKELQDATDKYYNTLNQRQIDAVKAASGMREQNTATREMIEATRQGPAAIEALTVAQAGADAVRSLGIGVSEKLAATVRREAEEHARLAIQLGHVQDAQREATDEAKRAADEAQRDMEHRAKELRRTITGAVEGFLTDISNKKNPFVALFDNLKRGAIRAISEVIATKIEGVVGDFLGIKTPASKQEKAAVLMNAAADKQLRAAGIMTGNTAGGITIEDSPGSAAKARFGDVLRGGAAGIGGYGAGYGIGSATGSRTVGVLGGAVSGAKLGNALLPGAGAVIGGLAGAVGGWIGAADAARETARRLEAARKAFTAAMEDFVATLDKNDLARSITSVKTQADALRESYRQTLTNQDRLDAARRAKMAGTYEEINRLEQERIQQLREEASIMIVRQIQDYQVRQLRAEGKTKEADALAFQESQLRERDDLVRSFGKEIDAREQEVLRAYDAAAAAEKMAFETGKAADAMKALTTSVNTVTGFKLADLNPYIQQFGEGRPLPAKPGQWTPPSSPNFTQSSTGTVATVSITIAPGAIVVNESKTPEMTADAIMNAVLTKVDQERNASGGLASARSTAFDKMKLRPGAIPWQS